MIEGAKKLSGWAVASRASSANIGSLISNHSNLLRARAWAERRDRMICREAGMAMCFRKDCRCLTPRMGDCLEK